MESRYARLELPSHILMPFSCRLAAEVSPDMNQSSSSATPRLVGVGVGVGVGVRVRARVTSCAMAISSWIFMRELAVTDIDEFIDG